MQSRERLEVFLDDGAFEEIDPTPYAIHYFGRGRVDGRPVYVLTTIDHAPLFDPTPADPKPSELPNPKLFALEARRLTRFFDIVRESPRPLVYLAGPLVFSPPRTVSPGLDVGFHPEASFGTYMKRLARLDVPKIVAVFAPIFAARALHVAQYDAAVFLQSAVIAMLAPSFANRIMPGSVTDPSYASAEVQYRAGTIDAVVATDADALGWARRYLASLDPRAPGTLGGQRYGDVFDPSSRRVFDARRVVTELVDAQSFVELRAGAAEEIVTGFGRLAGKPFGIVASNSKVQAGFVYVDTARKIARAVALFDRYRLPIVFLVDSNGIGVGSKAEAPGVFKAAGDTITAVASTTVPKVTVVLRRGATGGLHTMAGRGIGHRLFALDGAAVGGVAMAAMQANLAAAKDDAERRLVQAAIDECELGSLQAHGYIDGVIRDGNIRDAVLHAIDEIAPNFWNDRAQEV